MEDTDCMQSFREAEHLILCGASLRHCLHSSIVEYKICSDGWRSQVRDDRTVPTTGLGGAACLLLESS